MVIQKTRRTRKRGYRNREWEHIQEQIIEIGDFYQGH